MKLLAIVGMHGSGTRERGTLPLRLRLWAARIVVASFLLAGALYMLSGLAAIAVHGWREPMFDQYRQYRPILERPFPENILALENGHRPIIPNLFRLADIHWFAADQLLLLWTGGLLAAFTAGLVAWAALREKNLELVVRAALAMLAAIAVFWLGNARMLLHGNESVQNYLTTASVVAAAWATHRASLGAGARWMALAAICCVMATFSHGAGIATFPAVVLLGWISRVRTRPLMVVAGTWAATMLLYLVVLPGHQQVQGMMAFRPVDSVLTSARWLAGPMVNMWLGLTPSADWWIQPPVASGVGVGRLLVATATWFAGGDPTRWVSRSSVVLGLAGLLAFAVFLVVELRRRRPPTRLAAMGLGLALFGGATSLLIGITRLTYFEYFPSQLYAERYAAWPCLFWLGMSILGFDLSSRRGQRALLYAAFLPLAGCVALVAWPTHVAWSIWGGRMFRIAERSAAAMRLGVFDSDVMPNTDEGSRATIIRVGQLLRERRLAMFRRRAALWVGARLPGSVDAHPFSSIARIRTTGAFDDPRTSRRVLRFEGWLTTNDVSERPPDLFIVDASNVVVGTARWSYEPGGDGGVMRYGEPSGFDGYLFAPAACGPETLVALRKDGAVTMRFSTLDPCRSP